MLGTFLIIVGAILLGVAIAIILVYPIVALALFLGAILFIVGGFLINSLPRKNVKKKRTPYTAEFRCSKERVEFAIDVFMKENEYSRLKYNDEEVFKKGNGWWTMRRFIKCTINDDNTVLIEGWVSAGVGNAASTEIALTGFYGIALKKILIGEIQELKNRISNLSD